MKITPMSEVQVTGPMLERVNPTTGHRALKFRKEERKELIKQRRIETAVACFLTIDRDYKFEDIAREVGVSVPVLKEITKSDEFIALWNQHFVEAGHDPRLNTVKGDIADMLTTSTRVMREMLIDPETPASVRFNIIKEIQRLNGVDAPKVVGSDKNELTAFLKEANITQNNNFSVNIPPEFKDKINEYVDGAFEVPSVPLKVEET